MKSKTVLLLTALSLGMGLGKSSGSILLTINDTDPSAVTITATGLNSDANASGQTLNDGVDLLGFFSQDEFGLFGESLPNSTLTGGDSTIPYNDLAADSYSVEDSYRDLELYVDVTVTASTNAQTFSTSESAFTGSWTINLSDLGVDASALPTPGSQGNIISGYSFHPGEVIGQWQVAAVPEPGIGGLALLASAIGVVCRRRRR